MKRFLLFVFVLFVCLSGFAQEKKNKNDEKVDFAQSLFEAVKNSSFTFSAMTMKPSLGKVVPVDVPEKTVDVRPNHFMAEIVYDDVPSTAYKIPKYIVLDQPSYTYSADSTDKLYIVTVVVDKVPKHALNPNSKFVFTFRIKRNTGSTTLEVKPDQTHEIKYVGSVIPE